MYICVHIYIYIYVCIYVYIYIHTSTYIYIYASAYSGYFPNMQHIKLAALDK